jgi:hypothetical protein
VRHGELDPALRAVIAEDVFEAGTPMPNVTQIQIRAPQVDRPDVCPRSSLASCACRLTWRSPTRCASAKDSPNFAPTMTEW